MITDNTQFYSIASDFQRGRMLQISMQKAANLASESFYHGWGGDELNDSDLLIFAEDAWEKFIRGKDFDYLSYAHSLFLQAYRFAYHAYVLALPNGMHPNIHLLLAELETQQGLRPISQDDANGPLPSPQF